MTSRSLPVLDPSSPHKFTKPVKKISDGDDVTRFLSSRAYVDLGAFLMQLNTAMCPRLAGEGNSEKVREWSLDSSIMIPKAVKNIQSILVVIGSIVDEAPPDTGPRRFGNISFRKWFDLLESRVTNLLKGFIPADILNFMPVDEISAADELTSYLIGSFGSSQRLDYGSGHELSFLAFLGCLWKLGYFQKDATNFGDGDLERSIVIGIIEPYLALIRRLILTYTLEPAGSHGVWGLDDHFFLPYIFGSAQYCPAIEIGDTAPMEGSLPSAPNPADVTKRETVDQQRKHNMYFSAVGFIYDVKRGPFWEHSPILFDISGIRAGWGKINKGMIKMYNAEVLSKFPVVQHFPFGSLFSWDRDPDVPPVSTSIHTANQPPSSNAALVSGNASGISSARTLPQQHTTAPWAVSNTGGSRLASQGLPATRAPWASSGPSPRGVPGDGPTQAPWASGSASSAFRVSKKVPHDP